MYLYGGAVFDLFIEDPDGFVSESSTVEVDVLADSSPTAVAPEDFRFMSSDIEATRVVTLDGSASFDDTPKGTLSYQWTTFDNIIILLII